MTTYFQPDERDAQFVEQINEAFPEPANQPYLFYLFAGKQFYTEIVSKTAEQLVLDTQCVILAYKTAFQSRYSLEDLMEKSEATAALLAGSLTVVFTIQAHSLAIEIADNTLSISQGPYSLQMVFDEEHHIHHLDIWNLYASSASV